MPHAKRKIRKKRGSRTHGYGRVGQHRGGGQRGGRGLAGRQKHKWTYTVKYDPDHFGKRGFRSPNKVTINTINVGELDEKVDQLLKEEMAVRKQNGIHINLNDLGYDKLLGRGKATHTLIIHVNHHSKLAASKIETAKGKVIPIRN
ncbi:MAG: uL15 family ribosomal protein [Candidatus Bathyarchaeota archaeon]|jgi:large subunit ribosomal protein L15